MPDDVLASLPFKDAYQAGEIKALWTTLKKLYGSEDAARQAVAQNNQVLAPVYANPALMSESKAALVAVLGKDEALEVMRKSPMILTCGSELRGLSADDIRSTANTRQILDKFFTGPQGLLILVAALALLKVAGGVADAYGGRV